MEKGYTPPSAWTPTTTTILPLPGWGKPFCVWGMRGKNGELAAVAAPRRVVPGSRAVDQYVGSVSAACSTSFFLPGCEKFLPREDTHLDERKIHLSCVWWWWWDRPKRNFWSKLSFASCVWYFHRACYGVCIPSWRIQVGDYPANARVNRTKKLCGKINIYVTL